jgi:protein ImuB
LEESERPESVFLDVSGVCALFGGEGALADAAVRAVEGEGLRCRAAVADTAGAAWAGAHFASVGAGRAVLAPTGGSAAFLAPLPTAALRLRRPTLEALAEFGLKTVGDVLALPRRSLASRLGTEILLRLRQALGEEAEPLAAVAPAQTFVASWDFEQPIERGEVLESVLGRLCESLADELIRAGRGAGRLDCTLRCESSAPIVLTVGLFEPAAHAGHFLELLRLRLERRPLPGGVLGVRLEAGFTRALWSRPGNLFSESAGGDAKELAVLINRVAGRLGGDAVVRLHPRAEAQPELSWREAPLAAGGERKGRRAAPPCAARAFGLLERPLLLFDPPPAVEVACAPPDGPPDRFLWNGVSHRIARRVGPERIETGWWRGRGVRRDYYRVETDQGRRFWLYRSLRSGRWRLHGEFG